jgi:phosphoglycolate phosphatase-like HAD superfamily hydrolase
MQTQSQERLRAMLTKDVHIIWDFDGTLLDTNGAGVNPFEESLSEITGKKIKLERSKYSGFTDFEILEDLMLSVGLPELTHSQYLDFKSLYNRRLRVALDNIPAKAIKGAYDFLSITEQYNWIHNFIGTGNFFECGVHKVESARLIQYFSPERMYFCDFIHKSRLSIIDRAIQKIPKNQVIIGDSPRDIAVAHELKIPIIAVATGQHTFEELSSLKPHSTLSKSYTADLLLDIIQNFGASSTEMEK